MIDSKHFTLMGWMESYRYICIEILRMFLGGLIFYKGYYFVENISEIYAMIEQTMQISAYIVAHYVVVAHLVGGILLITGLLTRLAAFIQIPVLLGAVIFVHRGEFLMGSGTDLEYALLVLVLLTVFFFYGGGRLSLDYWLLRRKEKAAEKS
jgi:uncharacterized membrane protein YphA (DoxX/SURF4 family)